MFLRAISLIIVVGIYSLVVWVLAQKFDLGFFTGSFFILASTFVLLAITKVMRDGLLGVDEDEDEDSP